MKEQNKAACLWTDVRLRFVIWHVQSRWISRGSQMVTTMVLGRLVKVCFLVAKGRAVILTLVSFTCISALYPMRVCICLISSDTVFSSTFNHGVSSCGSSGCVCWIYMYRSPLPFAGMYLLDSPWHVWCCVCWIYVSYEYMQSWEAAVVQPLFNFHFLKSPLNTQSWSSTPFTSIRVFNKNTYIVIHIDNVHAKN